MSNRSKYYYPQLDFIRGFDFFFVYLFHAYHPHFGTGFFGRLFQYIYNNFVLSIDVFFILSAFLLTWLGINEYKAKGDFSFLNYFIRRALRIWPLYFLLMLFTFGLLPYLSSGLHVPVTLPPAVYYLLFISNYYLEGHVYFLKFLWTLSVEEQFYIIWGVCLVFFQKKLMVCVWIFTGVSIVYTVYAISNEVYHDFHTVTYLIDFAVGISVAVIMHKGHSLVEYFKKISTAHALVFFLSVPVLFILIFCVSYITPSFYAPWFDLLGRYIFIIYIGLVILEQMVNERTILKLKSQKLIIYTGKISYGLYCFHGFTLTFGLYILNRLHISLPGIVQIMTFFIINFIIAAASYRFIEKPFLRLKNKLRRA